MTKKPKTEAKIKISEGELSDKTAYVSKTNQEIRQLAIDVRGGNVFGSWSISEYEKNNLTAVFMPLMFLDDIMKKSLIRDNIAHFYGYMKDAAPRSINGMPMFFAFQCLSADDFKRLCAASKALEDFVKDD